MNQLFICAKKSSLVLLSLLLTCSVALAADLQIDWLDNSTNELGFTVEKRILGGERFGLVATLPANVESYTDLSVIADETYCYRITAFNDVGSNPSEESCLEVVSSTDPVYASGVALSHQFTRKFFAIEIGDKEFYSFKSNTIYNEWASNDEIYNVELAVNKGKLRYLDRKVFRFQRGGVELENGFARMRFNTTNSASFILQGHGAKQIATLYMKSKALGTEAASIIVTAGDKVEVITLPDGEKAHFFTIDIEFDDTTPVSITMDSDHKGGLMFAGMVFNYSGLVNPN